MAEFTTQRCVSQIDPEITRINCMTGLHPEAAMIPITLPTDLEAVDCALQTIGLVEPENARVVQISNTLHLSHVRMSEACEAEIQSRPDLEILRGPFPFPVNEQGMLADVAG